jgi:fermentation-respiration switch protein FrsA (DUF1100 family)
MDRADVAFASRSQTSAGWFYAADVSGRAPCVVMAHGLAGVKEMRKRCDRDATGRLRGTVRGCRLPRPDLRLPPLRRQRRITASAREHPQAARRWAAAVDYARSRDEVDPTGIILWGTSLSGGHVLAVAEKVGAAAVIAQVPHTDGLASALAVGPVQAAKLAGHAIYDAVRGVMGLPPHYVPASGAPGASALMTAPEARQYLDLVPDGYDFDQRVAARFVLRIGLYSPDRTLKNLHVPALVQVGRRDATVPPTPTIRAATSAPRTVLRVYDMGHFDAYTGRHVPYGDRRPAQLPGPPLHVDVPRLCRIKNLAMSLTFPVRLTRLMLGARCTHRSQV